MQYIDLELVDGRGKPVVGVDVDLVEVHPPGRIKAGLQAETDEFGRALFEVDPDLTFEARVNDIVVATVHSGKKSQIVPVDAGVPFPALTITVKAVDEDGAPVAGIEVSIASKDLSPSEVHQAITDANGIVRLPGVRAWQTFDLYYEPEAADEVTIEDEDVTVEIVVPSE